MAIENSYDSVGGDMTILVTGAAGFIGSYVSRALLNCGKKVIGVDNINDYYDISLKHARLKPLNEEDNFTFHHVSIADREAMTGLAAKYKEDISHVVHLAAQAGVRYSLENPYSYSESNLAGHLVILELCRHLPDLKHLVYASSSSVYGGNTKQPFAVADRTDNPVSLYAATKKAGELMAHSYNHLYNIPMTGLRFFTVYGPMGRPDMAYFSFTKAIFEGQPIKVFNNGDMRRDFTYIDDIVYGVVAAMDRPPSDGGRIYNLGNNKPEALMDMIAVLEQAIGKKAELQMEPMQPGDVKETYADIDDTIRDLGYSPKTTIQEGLPKFVEWYRGYYDF